MAEEAPKPADDGSDAVNRTRRSIFVFAMCASCLTIATVMGFRTDLITRVNEIVADGLISLAMFLAISYVAGSSIDYSGVLTRFGGGRNFQRPRGDDDFKGGDG